MATTDAKSLSTMKCPSVNLLTKMVNSEHPTRLVKDWKFTAHGITERLCAYGSGDSYYATIDTYDGQGFSFEKNLDANRDGNTAYPPASGFPDGSVYEADQLSPQCTLDIRIGSHKAVYVDVDLVGRSDLNVNPDHQGEEDDGACWVAEQLGHAFYG